MKFQTPLLLLTLASLLGPASAWSADPQAQPEEMGGIIGTAEMYLPGDNEEPVRIYFMEGPSSITDPNYDPQEVLRLLDGVKRYAARRPPTRSLANDDPKFRQTTVKEILGLSIQDLEMQARLKKRLELGIVDEKDAPTLEITPEERVDISKTFIEFELSGENYPRAAEDNANALRKALLEGSEAVWMEKLTFGEKFRSWRQFGKDIASAPSDPEDLKNSKKILGVHVDKQYFRDGLFYFTWRGLTSSVIWLNKGLPPEVALSLVFYQSALTFIQNTYGRQYSALFQYNPSFPGFRTKAQYVQWRRDIYYLGTDEIVLALAADGDLSVFLHNQLPTIARQKINSIINRRWGADLRDRLLGDSNKALRNFNRLIFLLTSPANTLDMARLVDNTIFDVRIAGLDVYRFTWGTVNMIGGYFAASRLLLWKPDLFEHVSDRSWWRKQAGVTVQKLGSVRNWIWNRCRATLHREAVIKTEKPANSVPPPGKGTKSPNQAPQPPGNQRPSRSTPPTSIPDL